MYCHVFYLCFILCALYLLFPPYSSIDVATVVGAPLIDYVTVGSSSCQTSFQASRALPLSQISPIFPYYSCIRHCCCCMLLPILLHNLSLSPFTIVPYLILCCLVYYFIIWPYSLVRLLCLVIGPRSLWGVTRHIYLTVTSMITSLDPKRSLQWLGSIESHQA